MNDPVFILEGPMGSAHCYRTEVGFLLYFEDISGNHKPEKIGEYALSQVNAVAVAFQDSKQFVGLDGWDKNWREFYEESISNGESSDEAV
jgi:hypothetical protein